MDKIESQTVTVGYDHGRKVWVLWYSPEPSEAGRFTFSSLQDLLDWLGDDELEHLADD